MSNDKVEVKPVDKLYGMLLYVCVQKPVKANQEYGPKPDEWKASVCITDEDVIDGFEEYARSLKTMTSVKKVKTSEFESIYKCKPPENAGRNVWVVTFRKSTMTKRNGETVPVDPQYAPRVYEKQGKYGIDVTNTKLPANGSMGGISIDVFKKKDGTGSMYLKSVLVTEMIEYIKTNNNAPIGSEWDVEIEPAKVESQTAHQTASKVTTKQETKPSKPSKTFEDLDDDIPF